MSPRERSSILHRDVSLTESIVRVMGIPKLACAAMCLNSSYHKSQYTLSSSFFFPGKFYFFGATEKRKKQGRDRRKLTISAEGEGGVEAQKEGFREQGFLFLLLGSKITAPKNQCSDSNACSLCLQGQQWLGRWKSNMACVP